MMRPLTVLLIFVRVAGLHIPRDGSSTRMLRVNASVLIYVSRISATLEPQLDPASQAAH